MLDADIGLRLGPLDLRLPLTVEQDEVVALVGPNGAGKTTALRAIAGLQPIDSGRIVLDGKVLDAPASGTFVPPHQRGVGMMFQDHLLFPRMTILDNVAFGLRAGGVRKAAARSEAGAALALVGLGDRPGARPAVLSGGEAQRVALARALATQPRVLLLDEPLAALDAQARPRIRAELGRVLDTFAGARLVVTHDPLDAIVLADRLVVLENGGVTQVGTVAEVTSRPASVYVAELLGVNLLEGKAAGERTVRLASGHELILADPLPAPVVAIALRPRAIALHRTEPDSSARNRWQATVLHLEANRDRVRVALGGPVVATAEVTPGAVAALELEPGERIWASAKAVDLVAYER